MRSDDFQSIPINSNQIFQIMKTATENQNGAHFAGGQPLSNLAGKLSLNIMANDTECEKEHEEDEEEDCNPDESSGCIRLNPTPEK